MTLFDPVFEALNRADVRYVVVGGVAVVLQGHARLTVDLDLVVDLSPEPALRTVMTLSNLGYVPSIPVSAADFAQEEVRRSWIEQKSAVVFSMVNPDNALDRIDLFIEDPFPFEDLWSRSTVVPLGTTEIRVASIEDLLTMKRAAGRAKDLADVEALEILSREKDQSDE